METLDKNKQHIIFSPIIGGIVDTSAAHINFEGDIRGRRITISSGNFIGLNEQPEALVVPAEYAFNGWYHAEHEYDQIEGQVVAAVGNEYYENVRNAILSDNSTATIKFHRKPAAPIGTVGTVSPPRALRERGIRGLIFVQPAQLYNPPEIAPYHYGRHPASEEDISRLIKNTLRAAESQGFTSVSLPTLGIKDLFLNRAFAVTLEALEEYFANNPDSKLKWVNILGTPRNENARAAGNIIAHSVLNPLGRLDGRYGSNPFTFSRT